MSTTDDEQTEPDSARPRLLTGGLGALAATRADDHASAGKQPAGDGAQTEPGERPAGSTNAASMLKGQLAVVTGAARGIGRATAVEFAANGADVVGLDICGPASAATLYPHSTPADLDETAAALVTVHLGGLCEMHRHRRADERQYFTKESAQMTVSGPARRPSRPAPTPAISAIT